VAVATSPSGASRAPSHHRRAPELLPGRLGKYAPAIAAVLATLVAIAAVATWHHDTPLHVELRIDHAISRLGLGQRFYHAGTNLASAFTFSFIVAALALWSALRRSWRELAACAAAPLTVLIVQVVLKPGVGRTIGVHDSDSFPSGHAAATTAWVTLAILLVLPVFPDLVSRVCLVAVGTATVVWSVLSVIALHWHYPVDAAAGVLTALAVVLGWCALVDRVADRISDRRKLEPSL
jgi:membrane-associated phospholipid phosphatase